MAKEFYGVIAVRFSPDNSHHNHITHVFMISVTFESNHYKYGYPGKLYTRSQAVNLLNTNEIYTLTWNYAKAMWQIGAKVSTEVVNGITYLRSKPDSTTRDNLTNLIDYDFFAL